MTLPKPLWKRFSSDLEEATEQLMNMSGDRVIDALLSGIRCLCARVQAELDGTSSEPEVAAQCVRPLLTEEHTNESMWNLCGTMSRIGMRCRYSSMRRRRTH